MSGDYRHPIREELPWFEFISLLQKAVKSACKICMVAQDFQSSLVSMALASYSTWPTLGSVIILPLSSTSDRTIPSV